MALRQRLTLPDCWLMAAICPELVSVRQHHRWGEGCGVFRGAQVLGCEVHSAEEIERGCLHQPASHAVGRVQPVPRRIEPRVHGDSWRQHISLPQRVAAAVAAAAGAEAAAAGADEPLPNPMHLRTDGAGTVFESATLVASATGGAAGGTAGSGSAAGGSSAAGSEAATAAAAAEEDTHVVEVVDPGK